MHGESAILGTYQQCYMRIVHWSRCQGVQFQVCSSHMFIGVASCGMHLGLYIYPNWRDIHLEDFDAYGHSVRWDLLLFEP